MSARPIAFGRSSDAATLIEWPMNNADDVVIATTHEEPHLRIYIRAQIKEQNKTTNVIKDKVFGQPNSQQKNRHISSDYWYAHALTKKVHCVHSIDRQRAIVNVPACSCLLQKHLWHISCSSGIVRPLVKSLPLVCAGLWGLALLLKD